MKLYLACEANNIDPEIIIAAVCKTKKEAQKALSQCYKNLLEIVDDSIEYKAKTVNAYSVLCFNGDYYYGQVKEIDC